MKLIGGEVCMDTQGEGSRGGHVVGHTSSGKPIYFAGKGPYKNMHYGQNVEKTAKRRFPGWTPEEHEQASRFYAKLRDVESNKPGRFSKEHDKYAMAAMFHYLAGSRYAKERPR